MGHGILRILRREGAGGAGEGQPSHVSFDIVFGKACREVKHQMRLEQR